jgi:hypothetical protein|tara:strand:- start:904 stop:1104 length:201 start_codon:yes stop_codon:yes gene_type:complete
VFNQTELRGKDIMTDFNDWNDWCELKNPDLAPCTDDDPNGGYTTFDSLTKSLEERKAKWEKKYGPT